MPGPASRRRLTPPRLRVLMAVSLALLLATLIGCAATDPADQVSSTSAQLHGRINAEGKPTTYWFQYGTTTAYGSETPHRDAAPVTTGQRISEPVSGLQPDATYHFRAVTQAVGDPLKAGDDAQFRTAAGAELLPDLVQAKPTDMGVEQAGASYRLGFTSAVMNLGAGPLSVSGHRPDTTATMVADQRVASSGTSATTTYPDIGAMQFYVPHDHWHYLGFDRYELRRASDNGFVAPDQKAGFCLGDRFDQDATGGWHEPPRRPGPYTSSDCERSNPRALAVEEGISVGYGDDYGPQVEGQYIDVTGVDPGRYVLVHRVNADGRLHEADYSNNAASVLIDLWPNGYGTAPALDFVQWCPGSDRCPSGAARAHRHLLVGRLPRKLGRLDPPLLVPRAARTFAVEAIRRRLGLRMAERRARCVSRGSRRAACEVRWGPRSRARLTVTLAPRADQLWWTYGGTIERGVRVSSVRGRVAVARLDAGR